MRVISATMQAMNARRLCNDFGAISNEVRDNVGGVDRVCLRLCFTPGGLDEGLCHDYRRRLCAAYFGASLTYHPGGAAPRHGAVLRSHNHCGVSPIYLGLAPA